MTYGFIFIATNKSGTIDSVQWDGPHIARVNADMLFETAKRPVSVGDYVELGSCLVYVAEYDMLSNCFIVQEAGGLMGDLHLLRFRLGQLWQAFSLNMIRTLIIWGLAKAPAPGERLHWGLVRDKWT